MHKTSFLEVVPHCVGVGSGEKQDTFCMHKACITSKMAEKGAGGGGGGGEPTSLLWNGRSRPCNHVFDHFPIFLFCTYRTKLLIFMLKATEDQNSSFIKRTRHFKEFII